MDSVIYKINVNSITLLTPEEARKITMRSDEELRSCFIFGQWDHHPWCKRCGGFHYNRCATAAEQHRISELIDQDRKREIEEAMYRSALNAVLKSNRFNPWVKK